jgi:hypothetical protein
MEQHRKAMHSQINWSDLEQRGLITPSPGREEAAKITQDKIAARKAAERAAVQSQAKRK